MSSKLSRLAIDKQLSEQQHILQAPIHDNLFVIGALGALGALGARGLCNAPICAELLCSQIFAEPIHCLLTMIYWQISILTVFGSEN
ncbi:tRNA 5-methylaminomethyl-2-thiouridine biosynthesis bifunctional protein MnmC [Arsenophonus endosymbiont of Bemisia tabaci Q2]|nr:tRNA 5-methylaminomethyl-2-thiouridine biosynthesis bifunctional protein MnmC [Arsenophonus endosymbiont of Bemisia tabaci Q2]